MKNTIVNPPPIVSALISIFIPPFLGYWLFANVLALEQTNSPPPKILRKLLVWGAAFVAMLFPLFPLFFFSAAAGGDALSIIIVSATFVVPVAIFIVCAVLFLVYFSKTSEDSISAIIYIMLMILFMPLAIYIIQTNVQKFVSSQTSAMATDTTIIAEYPTGLEG